MKIKKEQTTERKILNALTTKHTGKMNGIVSLSTSCKCNKQCAKNREISGSICEKCFAAALLESGRGSNLAKKLERNTELLTNEIINVNEIPFINAAYFRFEAFGDLNNEIQLINYFNIANKNKQTQFTIFTKNPHIIAAALNHGYKKPRNLIIIYSSLFMNIQTDPRAKYPFIDKIFTVYDKTHIGNVNYNCCQSCAKCLKCYNKHNKDVFINELVHK